MPEGTSYLNELSTILTSKAPASTPVTDLGVLQQAWDCVSANVVKKAHESFEEAMKTGIEREEALEKCSQERFVAAKVHTTGYLYR
jgi:acyl-CoA oxidase